MNICIFYCSNSLDANALKQNISNNEKDEVNTVSLPCSGKVNLLYLLKAFENGADGVILVTCGQNECHFLEGNLRAKKRAEAVDSMLEEIGLGKGRMIVIRKNNEGIKQITTALEQLKKDLS
ncbi:MAG: hydrogenase iron-sulfur subunit [Deltaproteobacteria bacterium]|nr:hydrogenase iron-sulfur subunit [Deltaproteobacteria bacterium]